jgi:hypothetical protein
VARSLVNFWTPVAAAVRAKCAAPSSSFTGTSQVHQRPPDPLPIRGRNIVPAPRGSAEWQGCTQVAVKSSVRVKIENGGGWNALDAERRRSRKWYHQMYYGFGDLLVLSIWPEVQYSMCAGAKGEHRLGEFGSKFSVANFDHQSLQCATARVAQHSTRVRQVNLGATYGCAPFLGAAMHHRWS